MVTWRPRIQSPAGTGGSGSDTTGGTAGTGRGGSGGSSAGNSGRGGSSSGGAGAVGGASGQGGAGAVGGVSGQGGVGAAGGVSGSAGSVGYGGVAGATGGSFGSGGTTNCSQPTLCLTCEQLLQRFSYFLDGFSCGASAAPVCPNLMGAGTMACENVCTMPVVQGELCCYGLSPSLPACGRPFTVGDHIRRAPIISRADWKRATANAEHGALDPELERALAAEWEQDAALEHASIASFARLTLELLALGAPAELIRESQAASLDEIQHAELCFALASRYRRSPIGPGALAVEGALTRPELATLAAETVREGCVGETLAALLAVAQLERATDPQVRAALARIADDEARHAELSWKIVRWAIATGGNAVSDAVGAAFERAVAASRIQPASVASSVGESKDEAWHAHGRLFSDERRAVVCAGLAEVIEPCAQALLG